jgi:hypothetical protein
MSFAVNSELFAESIIKSFGRSVCAFRHEEMLSPDRLCAPGSIA